MAIDTVQVNSSTGVDGNSYTTAISNDKLSNNDFLKLLLEEMKMQDPTKPMDSQKMMESQLQMSTIEANVNMSKAMAALQSSYANSAISTAAGIIGNIVENGDIDDKGSKKLFKVDNVENKDGTMYINAYELQGYKDSISYVEGDTKTNIKYDSNGNLYDTSGNITNIRIKLDNNGRFELNNGNIILLDSSNNVITDENILAKYLNTGQYMTYSDKVSSMPMGNITKVKKL